MDCIDDQHENIRKIEDIIDIQKAKGKYDERQVVFNLPSETESRVPANLAKSLESGLIEQPKKKKLKKTRSRRRNQSPLPDVISWPSDSDITVLRMKLCITKSELKENMGTLVPGDGLHHPDSSSMVNLATLMKQTNSRSRQSLVDEYLLPLTSWEEKIEEPKEAATDSKTSKTDASKTSKADADKAGKAEISCQSSDERNRSNCDHCVKEDTKWSIIRFFRLYFCPCCACLYKFESPSDDFTQTRPVPMMVQGVSYSTSRNFD